MRLNAGGRHGPQDPRRFTSAGPPTGMLSEGVTSQEDRSPAAHGRRLRSRLQVRLLLPIHRREVR